jgi:DNA-binding MarR family transcriptional regulator
MKKIVPQNSCEYSRYLIGKARIVMFRARKKELAPYHISPRQANILYILHNLGHKATLLELSHHADRKINTISIQMTRMERDGLVTKTREIPNSTLLKFELTEKGVDTYKNCKKLRSVKEIMSVLSKDKRNQLISMLETIISKAEKYQSV